jgi:heme iron utilization protein
MERLDMAERHHGFTTQGDGREVPEPSFAERARTLLVRGEVGTLATPSRRHSGFPFASLMPYAPDARGRPVVLVSDLAVHTRNLKEDDRASLLVLEPGGRDRNPLGLARVTLLGRLGGFPGGDEAEAVRELYLERHPTSRYWVDYPDFGFRRMEVEEAYYVGGFGVMGWVSREEYEEAEPDPLLDHADSILAHVNADHPDALVLLARREGMEEVEEARMTAVDRLGYELRVRTAEGMRGLRIPFPEEARSPGRVREFMVDQVRRARKALSGS